MAGSQGGRGREVVGVRVAADRLTPAVERYLDGLERLEFARLALVDTPWDNLRAGVAGAVQAVADGVPVASVLEHTPLDLRKKLIGILTEMNSALAEARVGALRVLVDDEAITLSDAARILGIPRQVASRLYHRSD